MSFHGCGGDGGNPVLRVSLEEKQHIEVTSGGKWSLSCPGSRLTTSVVQSGEGLVPRMIKEELQWNRFGTKFHCLGLKQQTLM